MIITMTDIRQVGICSHGVRLFCKQQGFDYVDFLKNGVDAVELIKTNDGMALDVVNHVKNKTKVV